MTLSLVDDSNCKLCIHNRMCKEKKEKTEIIDKLKTKVDNIIMPGDYFKVSFCCKEYYPLKI